MGGSGSKSKNGGDAAGGLTPSALNKLAQLLGQEGAKWAAGLNEFDQRAFNYFLKDPKDLQAGLETGTLTPAEKQVVDRLNRAIEHSKTERDTIGFVTAKGSPKGLQKGSVLTLKGFVKTQLDSRKVSGTDTLYRIRVPKGQGAAYLPSLGAGKSPAFMLKSGGRYKVGKIGRKGGRDIVDLTYLG